MLGGEGHLAHEVRREEHGAPLGREPRQQRADPQDALWVEAVDGLVEDERLGVTEEGRGDAQTLAHTEGEPAGALVGDVAQAHEVDDLLDATATDPGGGRHDAQVVGG